MAILVTGGAGYIGSHTCVELLNAGYDVVVADNLYNSSKKAVDRVEQITGKKLKFYEVDLLDQPKVKEIFDKEEIEAVIHFAGLKAVGESVHKPKEGVSIYNLGTGVGYSVLDVLHAYEKACGKTLKYEIQPRRDGDIATCYSDCTKAKEELGWVAEKGIEEMCADSWRWQSMNPNGYRD